MEQKFNNNRLDLQILRSSANGRVKKSLTARVTSWSARVTLHSGSLLSLKDVSNM